MLHLPSPSISLCVCVCGGGGGGMHACVRVWVRACMHVCVACVRVCPCAQYICNIHSIGEKSSIKKKKKKKKKSLFHDEN